jgi:hypothetical protein
MRHFYSYSIIVFLVSLGFVPFGKKETPAVTEHHLASAFFAPSVVDVVITSEVFNGSNLNVSFSTTQLNLPTGSLNNSTVNSNTVKLFEQSSNTEITNTTVNATGGGDAITLTANGLDYNTTYRIEISNGVQDLMGESMTPFSKQLTTSVDPGNVPSSIEFEQVVVANGSYTSLTVGPDGKMYGLVNNGAIHRWDLAGDGTLSNQQTISTIQTAEGGNRLAIGLDFDPSATANNLIAWVSHTSFGFSGQPDWQGKISQLSGDDLENIQDYVVNLPRSTRDHVTNSIEFGPDGKLYFNQGSNSAMGAADGSWGNRDERLLTAAVLRLDTDLISSLPLDAQTGDGGTYDPFAANAPLTIYSSGTRNHYDLLWHTNGNLYVPTNGSAAGGNTPSFDPNTDVQPQRIDGATLTESVTGISGVNQTQPDLLFRCVEGGYYGHPNPSRGEYVMNGGNPTSGPDPIQVNQYPVGTNPDVNWRSVAYNFENNKSPNGVIEYLSNTFNSALQNKIMVVRYSGGDDIIVLTPGGTNNDIVSAETGITGFTGFSNPLDLCENKLNGHIYVSEYGSGEITLLRPVGSTGGASDLLVTYNEQCDINEDEIYFSIPKNTTETFTVTLENNGGSDVTISSLSLNGTNANLFSVEADGQSVSLPLVLTPAGSQDLDITFAPSGSVGPFSASLDLTSDDPVQPNRSISLHGLSANGIEGGNEPPMADIMTTLGYDINVGWTSLGSNTSAIPIGDEVLEPLFEKAGSGDVTMKPVARYSPDFILPFGYYLPNGNTPTLQQVGVLATAGAREEHQILFPAISSGGMTFDPGSDQFGFYTTSPSHTAYTEDALNAALNPSQVEHAVRVYEVNDRVGNPVPNTYLLGFEEASNGDYNDYVFVVSNVTPAGEAPPPGADVVRIDAGGTGYTAVNGDVFAPDDVSLITGETMTNTKNFDVGDSDDDPLYLAYRFGENFTYNIPVANGTYTVRLHHAEIFQTATGQRIFSVNVEGGQGVTTNLDLVQEVGFGTALINEYTDIEVTDGAMSIAFSFSEDNALIQGIEVIGTSADPNTAPAIAISAPVDGSSATQGDNVTLTADANDTEDGDLDAAIMWSSNLDGSLGQGGTIMTSALSLGTHVITANVEDSELAPASDNITFTITAPPSGDILYREIFWNEDVNNNLALANRGWNIVGPGGGGVNLSQVAASNGLGKPAGLQNINAIDVDPTPADGRGFAAAFASQNEYFFWTDEHSIDLNNSTITDFTWYQGHNEAGATSQVAIRIGTQWYVSNQTFSGPGLGSGGDFVTGAEQKSLPFTTAAADWATLDIADLSISGPLGSDLPTGAINGFGLLTKNASGFTARFDTYQIGGTTGGGPSNQSPVVDNPIMDQDATEGVAFNFTVPANTFSDPDEEVLTYSATEQGEATLPGWLSFDANNQTFAGTPAPTDVGTYSIEVTAQDPSLASASDVFDLVVTADADNCGPISPALCHTIPISLTQDYCLEWDTDEGGLADGSGTGTGFTMVSAPSSNLDPATPSNSLVPGYEPSNLSVSGGALTITATKGIFFKVAGNNGNSQVNALGVGFDASAPGEPYEITSKLNALPTPQTNSFQQAGLWFGLNEAEYVKLVAIVQNGGVYKVQLGYETGDDLANSDERNTGNILNPGDEVVLKMIIDPVAQTIEGWYSLDDGATFIQVETTGIQLNTNMFTGTPLPDNSQSVTYAGVHGTIRNASASNTMDFSFENFCIDVPETSTDATLDYTVSLQGRTDHSGSYQIDMYSADHSENDPPLASFAEAIPMDGTGTLTGLIAGSYQVKIKHPKYLAAVETITLAPGANNLNFGELLGGDVNNSNGINLTDFSVLASTYGTADGDQGYDDRADISGDLEVELSDFSILASNYNLDGEEPLTSNQFAPQSYNDPILESELLPVTMAFEATSKQLQPGETVTVDVRLTSPQQAYDGVQVQLGYDQDLLELEEASLNNELDITLQETNEPGIYTLAMGTLGVPLQKDLNVVRLTFRALKAGAGEITLHNDQSKVTYAGYTLQGSRSAREIIRVEPLATSLPTLPGKKLSMELFPNPGDGLVNIAIEGLPQEEGGLLEVRDMLGRTVARQFISGSRTTTINISSRPAGMYLVQLQVGNDILFKRYQKR